MAAASLVRAQAPDPSFDELARRAQEAVDSKPAEAVALFRQALALRPSWADGWLYLGAELYQLNRYREARDAFRNGIPLAPGNGTAWGFLGLCEYELGDSDGALADIRKGEALGLGGNREFQTAVRVRGALILIHAKAFDVAAVEQLRPLLMDFQADSPAVIEALGLCALAIPRLPSELPASKRPVVDLAGKALWANMSKRSAEAESAFRELLEKYPQEPGVHYAHGVYLMDYDQRAALAEFQKELEVDPTQWPSLLFSIMLELKRGQPETAIQLIERAARLVPEGQRWVCHAQMGNALLALGRFEKAIPELETAVRLQPSNSSLHFSLQKAYRLAGRQAEAEREGTEFLRLKAQEDPLSLPGRAGGSTGAVR
ncbi:MAG: tetratricopeptide repeat protein [Bryobacteraceae bacterium]